MKKNLFPLPDGAQKPFFVSRTAQAVRVENIREKAIPGYLKQLENAGFTCTASHRYPGGLFYTYTDGKTKLTVSYVLRKLDLRIIFEEQKSLPELAAQGAPIYDRITLTQFSTHTSKAAVCSTASGMGYVLRLRDGRLIVVDGGFHSPPDYEDDYPAFRQLLWDLSGGKKPHVALWLITHPHADHFHVLTKMTEEDATVDAYLSSLVKREAPYSGCADDMERRIPHFAAKNVSAHTGDSYDLGDAVLEIYACCEELEFYDPRYLSDQNNQSMIFAFTIGDQKILFTGDGYFGIEDYALMIAGGRVRADICQIAHHGRTNHRDDIFYSLVAPKVALWPGCYAQIDNDLEKNSSNTWILGPDSTVIDHYVATDGNATLTFPYETKGLPYRSPLQS